MSDIPWMQCERFEDIECFSGELFYTLVFGDCSEEDLSDVSSSASNSGVFRDFLECVPWSEGFIENNNLLIENNSIPTRLLSKEEKELKMFIYNELLKLGV